MQYIFALWPGFRQLQDSNTSSPSGANAVERAALWMASLT